MRCEKARPLISAGLDGELDEIGAAQLRTHLAECIVCATERETLAATVRLLRDLPEAEPPAELRRRIGAALMDVERAAPRHRLELAWLPRPRAPGWAWGGALGAAAAVVLLATRGPAPAPRVAAAPQLPPAGFAAPPSPVRPPSGPRHERKPPAAPPRKPALAKPRVAPPLLTAPLRLAESPVTPPPLRSSRPAGVPERAQRRAASRHLTRHSLPVTHRAGPSLSAPLATAPAAPPAGAASPDRPVRTNDDSPRLARTESPSNDPSAPPSADQSARSETAGMTQMASGGAMPAPAETETDDLVELRRRLIDRPLQVPELGQLKPAASPRSKRDGWIRF